MIKTFFIAFAIFATSLPAGATTLLRDADIEYALSKIARPILQIAGLRPSQVKILLVDDTSFNAFVIDGNHIFLNSGLLMKCNSPEMLQSVIAHEVAHIANGHISRRRQNMQVTQNTARFGIALALIAGGSNQNQGLGAGLAIGISNSAQRVFHSHTQSEEISADQTALLYFSKLGIDPNGTLQVLDYLSDQEYLSNDRQDPYTRTHPLSSDRLRMIKGLLPKEKATTTDLDAIYWHARARAKVSAFLQERGQTLAQPKENIPSDIVHMHRAITLSRRGKLTQALEAIENAQMSRPNDAFYQELKAEILMRNRQFSRSADAYEKAVAMAPDQALILAGYGRALLAAGQTENALNALKKARDLDFLSTNLLHDLALAYAKLGNRGMASLVTAERFGLKGNLDDAKRHAKTAEALLPRGSPAWQRTQDVLYTNDLN